MRRILYVFLCLIIVFLASCKNRTTTPAVSVNPAPAAIATSLLRDVRAISARWQDDRLIYLADNGLFAYSPSDGRTETLMSDDISKRDISWVNYEFSPDKSKYIMVTVGMFDNTLEIRSTKAGKSVLILDARKYREGVGGYDPPVSQTGWVDNENVFIATGFRLFIINIATGEEVQVTEECSPVTTKVSHNTEAPYLSWARNVMKIGDKLYYDSSRDLQKLGSPSIYCGDKSGERELLKNAMLLISVDNRSLVYSRESKPGYYETYVYDTETGKSALITDQSLLSEGIFRTNGGKLSFMTGDMTGGKYQGVIFDPATLQSERFDVYDGERDFPDNDTGSRQFGHFMGAFEKDGEYLFLFSVENFSKSQQKYLKKYLAYSPDTNKPIEMAGYGDTWLVNMSISPSGMYIAITKHKSPSDNYFLFDVIKADNLLPKTEINVVTMLRECQNVSRNVS